MKFIRGVCASVSLVLIGACSKSSIVGEDFMGDDSFEISYSDTIALRLNTIRYDSLPTSTSKRLLIGDISDSVFSTVSADAYFLMSLPSSMDIGENETFDSLTFYLPQDGYAIGFEEVQAATIKLEHLQKELEYPASGVFYNFSKPAAATSESQVLFEQEVKFYIDRDRDVRFRLADELGQELFESISDGEDILESSSEFHQYLKGFRLSIDSHGDNAAIGLVADSIHMRLHTTDHGIVPPVSKTIDFYVSGSPYFTRYAYDTPDRFSSIGTFEDEVNSSFTSNASLIHGGLGYAVEVAIPSAAFLKLDGERNYVITGANLKLYPPDTDLELPEELSVQYIDESHTVLSAESAFSTYLVLDEDHGRDTYYSVDIGNLIEYVMDPQSNETYSMLITLPSDPGNNSLTSLWLGNESFSSELILYTISNK